MTNYSQVIVGVFNTETDAKNALDALRNAGFKQDQLGFALREGGLGTSTLRDDLVKLGIQQDQADYYYSEYQNGRPIVSVRADGREQEAASILSNYGSYDYGTQSGTATTGTNAYADRAAYAQTTATDDERRAMKLREEQLNVQKQAVQAGEVRLHKEVVAEQQNIDVPVQREEVYIEQRPVTGGQVSDTPIGTDETIRVPVTEEQVNVTKSTVETGEVSIGKRAVQETQHVTDTVRKERPVLEREGDARIHTNDDLTNR